MLLLLALIYLSSPAVEEREPITPQRRQKSRRPITLPFQPRDLEKRKQAVSVWTSFLAFITFHWHNYGADGALEAMGLQLSWPLKDFIDTIDDYAEHGQYQNALQHAVKGLLIQVITNALATPQTNPLVWWLAVLIQTEVLDTQPRWCIAHLQDTLDFPQRLKAIDHYARVLLLEDAFYRWIDDPSPHRVSPIQKRQVVDSLDQVSLDWLDRDGERPPIDPRQEIQQMASPGWTACPMSAGIKLRQGRLVPRVQKKQYCVKAEIHENYTLEPLMADCYPALIAVKATIKNANQAAREYLRDELGHKHLAKKWDEVYETGGKIRVRAIYKDDANDAKAIVWVEEMSVG